MLDKEKYRRSKRVLPKKREFKRKGGVSKETKTKEAKSNF